MKAFICAPVRNRGWVLPSYCEAIKNQNIDYETYFLINDSEDNSEEIIRDYGYRVGHYHFINNSTESHTRGNYSFYHLSYLRNQLVDEFLKSDCDVFVSIDSDVIIPDKSLEQLLSHDKDIVSMLIRNHPSISAYNIMNNGRHFPEPPPRGIIPVDLTGAVYAVKREVLEAGVRYNYHKQGEDFPFCESAKEKGFEVYCDTTLTPIHAYNKDINLIAKTGGPL